MPDVTVSVPYYTNVTVEVDLSDHISELEVTLDDDEILAAMDDVSDKDALVEKMVESFEADSRYQEIDIPDLTRNCEEAMSLDGKEETGACVVKAVDYDAMEACGVEALMKGRSL